MVSILVFFSCVMFHSLCASAYICVYVCVLFENVPVSVSMDMYMYLYMKN